MFSGCSDFWKKKEENLWGLDDRKKVIKREEEVKKLFPKNKQHL